VPHFDTLLLQLLLNILLLVLHLLLKQVAFLLLIGVVLRSVIKTFGPNRIIMTIVDELLLVNELNIIVSSSRDDSKVSMLLIGVPIQILG
jgi:hypothetical protein